MDTREELYMPLIQAFYAARPGKLQGGVNWGGGGGWGGWAPSLLFFLFFFSRPLRGLQAFQGSGISFPRARRSTFTL